MSAAPRAVEHATRRVFVEHAMGMPISVHVRGADARGLAVEQAVAALFDDLRDAEAVFSTYRPDSEISRLQRGELTLADCRPEVREVHRLLRGRAGPDRWVVRRMVRGPRTAGRV